VALSRHPLRAAKVQVDCIAVVLHMPGSCQECGGVVGTEGVSRVRERVAGRVVSG
jgi:hypothetical protein